MGAIRTEVRELHLNRYPDEEEILKPFMPAFFVTWGRRRRAHNTEVSMYILNPEPFMAEAFGFDQEIMLIYSDYDKLEPRSIQAAEACLADDPARGRVEKLAYYFVSEAPDTEQWMHSYMSVNQEARLIIPLSASDLRAHAGDAWHVRNKTSKLLYGRDLFDYRLPLEHDTYFFGRSELAVNLFDAIKRAENRGIFGLRKTGKTSLLFKLERMLQAGQVAEVLYFDCKLPSIRKLRWFELVDSICAQLATRLGLQRPPKSDERTAAEHLLGLAASMRKPVLLMFDEIEYISPVAQEDGHWRKDFVAFWQTFWACQSRHRTISAMIAGVNPSAVEMDSVDGIQNPLFGIVSYQYLRGLADEETRNMIRVLGKRMGLKFDHTATEYVYRRYGGHPLLTRMACSVQGQLLSERGADRPVLLTQTSMAADEGRRDAELMFYCRHVVSELKQFYPEEYEMLELLASGQVHDFLELAAYPEYTKHLQSYGLLGEDGYRRPTIVIPVVARYIGLELARREGRQTLFKIVPSEERSVWIAKRVKAIATDMRLLECALAKTGRPSLFGPNSFPRADEFSSIPVVSSEDDFAAFMNTCNKCFVESIENYGASVGRKKYYWDDVRTAYPGLWHALQRIKIYRHERMHLALAANASADLLTYLSQDLEGKNPSTVRDCHFVLQQCVLDGLLTGIQIEISNAS